MASDKFYFITPEFYENILFTQLALFYPSVFIFNQRKTIS